MMQNLDRFAEGWWQWQAGVFLQVAVLVGLVAVVDLAIRRWAWPRLRHALWLLVLLKLLLPPSLTSPVSLLGHFRQEAGTPKPVVTVQAAEPVKAIPAAATPKPEPGPPVAAGMPTAVVPAARTPLSWQAGLLCLWALGVAGLALWLVVRLRRFRRELALAASSEPPPEWLDRVTRQVASQLKLRRIPPVQFSHATQSPAVFGLFRPVVLLPATGDLTETEARHVLLHELAHIKRGDLVLHALHLALLVLYWHNPLLWLSRRFFQNLRELCCDATVANALRQEVPAYRQTLLVSAQRLLAQPTVPGLGLLGWSESGHWLGVRLKWLERNTWKRRWLQIVTTVCLVLIVAGCVLPMGRRASEYDTLGVVTFPKATPEAKRVLDLYAAHREQAPLRYALVCRTERDLTVTFRDGDRFYEANYNFGVDAGGRRPTAEAVAADSKRAGQTLESMLAWTADRAPVYLRLSDGRYSRVCHADGFGGLTNEPKDAVLGSYDLRTMLKSAKTLRSLGWPEPLIAPDALQVRLVSDDPYALDHGLVCLEFAFPPSPQESGRQGSKVTARPWTSRYYLDPQKGYVCRRQQAWPSGYLAEITAFTSTGNGGFLPATVVEVGSLYASEPTSGWKESITSIVCTLDPTFPDGIFDPDALESRYTMRYPRADRVTGRKTVLRWRSLAEVNGTVLDGDTGEPIAGAQIRVVSPAPGTWSIWGGSKAGSAVVETRSDGTGGFTLHVPVERNGNGSLAADARMPGFSSASRYRSGGLGWVSANQGSVLDLSIRLRRAKYVAGVVVDASGQPLANARVSANLVGGEGESGIRRNQNGYRGAVRDLRLPPAAPRPRSEGSATDRAPRGQDIHRRGHLPAGRPLPGLADHPHGPRPPDGGYPPARRWYARYRYESQGGRGQRPTSEEDYDGHGGAFPGSGTWPWRGSGLCAWRPTPGTLRPPCLPHGP